MAARVRGTDTPHVLDLVITDTYDIQCFQCFDAVGWAAGRASGL